jgi:hypothetical protein
MTTENRRIRDAIVATISSVPNIGNVFSFERYAASEKAFRDLYESAGQVRGWHVRRTARVETGAHGEVRTTWEIRVFWSLSDADESELAFDDAIDAVIDAFRADPRLGGVVFTPLEDQPDVPEIIDSGPVKFAGVLCHSARLRHVTRSAG